MSKGEHVPPDRIVDESSIPTIQSYTFVQIGLVDFQILRKLAKESDGENCLSHCFHLSLLCQCLQESKGKHLTALS